MEQSVTYQICLKKNTVIFISSPTISAFKKNWLFIFSSLYNKQLTKKILVNDQHDSQVLEYSVISLKIVLIFYIWELY